MTHHASVHHASERVDVTRCRNESAAERRALRLGVISNPNSGRNRKHLGSVDGILKTVPGSRHFITDSASSIPQALAEFAREGVNVVALNGGDGTVAHALEGIILDSPFAQPPLLCALPGGTTNVTVGDVGIKGSLCGALMKLLRWLRLGDGGAELVERPVIGVRDARGRRGGCGLVFGAGAVVEGIKYWQEEVRARGMRSEFSSGLAMTRTVWGMLRGHARFASPTAMSIRLADGTLIEGEFRLLVVSSLERLFLGIHPFWGTGEGSLHLTAIERDAPGFLRALPSILRGHPGAAVRGDAAYHSADVDRLSLGFEGSYTLDGELHHVAAGDGPVEVFDAGRATFVRIH
jgi:diacylglycerol kinase family enzyme